jgi:HEAT repeat protein
MKNQLFVATTLLLACGFAQAASSGETALTTAFSTIDNALHAKNPDTRREAVKALTQIGSNQLYQGRLEGMLTDKDVQVRLSVVASLAQTNNVKALRVALDDRTPEVRLAAAKELFERDDPAARAALLRILKGETKTSSTFIAREERAGLHTLETPKPLLLTAVRYGGALAPLPGAGIGIALLLKAMSKPGTANRAAIALLLGAKKDPEVIAALEQALTDKDALVRAAAIQALGTMDDPALARDAESMLSDRNLTVRLSAAACYLRLSSVSTRGSGTVVRSWQD